MKIALILALCGAPLLASSAPVPIEDDAIMVVYCQRADGRDVRGTAFHIGGGRIITAAHVTGSGSCTIKAGPLTIIREDGKADIAELASAYPGPALKVSCRRIRAGNVYRAIGWGAAPWRLTLPLVAVGYTDPETGHKVMLGELEHGMSGGPVLDAQGRVVAINNMKSPARVRALRDSFVCGK